MAEGASSKNYNMRNPAVKRILQEVKEMAREESADYMSMPLEEDIFEWQFAVHGPKDSEFEGGIYHGRITLPSEYPFKPPSFMLLTPSGRFEVQTKICLSISNHHPEHWQPSWSVRTALVALIAFMPTKPNGAIGSLDYTKKERRALAMKSRQQPPQFGSPERQRIIQQLHEAMLKSAPPVPTTPLVEDDPAAPGGQAGEPAAAAAAAATPSLGPPKEHEKRSEPPTAGHPVPEATSDSFAPAGSSSFTSQATAVASLGSQASKAASSSQVQAQSTAGAGAGSPPETVTEAAVQPPAAVAGPARAVGGVATRPSAPGARSDAETYQEWLLSAVAAVLVVAILYILGQKIARAYTGVAFTGGESEL